MASPWRAHRASPSSERRPRQAEARYAESLRIKADFYDAAIAMAQHAYESARLLAASGGTEAAMEARAPSAGWALDRPSRWARLALSMGWMGPR